MSHCQTVSLCVTLSFVPLINHKKSNQSFNNSKNKNLLWLRLDINNGWRVGLCLDDWLPAAGVSTPRLFVARELEPRWHSGPVPGVIGSRVRPRVLQPVVCCFQRLYSPFHSGHLWRVLLFSRSAASWSFSLLWRCLVVIVQFAASCCQVSSSPVPIAGSSESAVCVWIQLLESLAAV